MKPETSSESFHPSSWEEDLIREAEDLHAQPGTASWTRLEALLDRKRPTVPVRMLRPFQQWILAASLAGLALLTWLLVRPSPSPNGWTVQEISEPSAGYYRNYLAAAHGLSGYRPINEGVEQPHAGQQPNPLPGDTLGDL